MLKTFEHFSFAYLPPLLIFSPVERTLGMFWKFWKAQGFKRKMVLEKLSQRSIFGNTYWKMNWFSLHPGRAQNFPGPFYVYTGKTRNNLPPTFPTSVLWIKPREASWILVSKWGMFKKHSVLVEIISSPDIVYFRIIPNLFKVLNVLLTLSRLKSTQELRNQSWQLRFQEFSVFLHTQILY